MRRRISLELQSALGNKTGIGWYTYNLTKELCKKNENTYIGEIFSFRKKDLNEMQIPNLLIVENRFFPYRLFDKLRKYINYNFLMKTHSDIYCFFNFHIPSKIKGKIIVVIHDVVFAEYPESCKKPKPLSAYIESIEKSDIIVTVSESSKRGILKYFKVNPDKIKIVPPGIYLEDYQKKYAEEELKLVKEKYKLSGKFILYLGTIEPRKNISNIILAFDKYKSLNNDNLKLVIAGRKGWKYEEIFEVYKNSKYKNDILFIDYVDEKDKIKLYKSAELFIFPSLYEGFGMPVLEAMAAGVPVITSNISSLPEVAGEGAILVNPNSVEEISKAMKKIIYGDKEFVEKMIKEGKKQAEKYTWEKSAEKLEQIYSKL